MAILKFCIFAGSRFYLVTMRGGIGRGRNGVFRLCARYEPIPRSSVGVSYETGKEKARCSHKTYAMDRYEHVRAIVTIGLKNDPVSFRILAVVNAVCQDWELKNVNIIVQLEGRH